MINMKKLTGAPVAMRNKGLETDDLVLQIILEKSGSTVHEIADYLGWTNGKVDGSINRLLRKGKVRVEHVIRRRTLIKKVYPAEKKTRPPEVIEIPKEEIAEDIWKDEVYLYSLSRSSIAISAAKSDEWEERAFWKGSVKVEEENGKLLVQLPEKLASFYRLENSEISLSTNDDFALVTVESTIVPVQLPPSYPSIPELRKTRYFIMVEKIEQIGAIPPLQHVEFYGKYPVGEDVRITTAGLSVSETNTVTMHKKEKEGSVTSQKVESPIQVVVK
jgi:predicted transcriptional regulator